MTRHDKGFLVCCLLNAALMIRAEMLGMFLFFAAMFAVSAVLFAKGRS